MLRVFASIQKGMIFGTVNDQDASLRVTWRGTSTTCKEFTLQNIPEELSREPLRFSQLDKFVNQRPAYRAADTNLYLSFVHNQGEGTWIYGDQIGVDSGTMFARIPHPTFTPLDAAGGWQAWGGKEWLQHPDMKLECTTHHIIPVEIHI